METIRIQGRAHQVLDIAELETIPAQLARLMKARGFNAYGYVRIDGAGDRIPVYRAATTGAWQILHRPQPTEVLR